MALTWCSHGYYSLFLAVYPRAATPRKPSLTDLPDDPWALWQPLIPPPKPGGRPREVDLRDVIHTIVSLHRTGCQWDMLPHDLRPKSTVYAYLAQWRCDGTWPHRR